MITNSLLHKFMYTMSVTVLTVQYEKEKLTSQYDTNIGDEGLNYKLAEMTSEQEKPQQSDRYCISS